MNDSGDRFFLGLHIPKTAGTTLSGHIKGHSRNGQAYLCSSFLNNRKLLGELDFPEWGSVENLRIAFGHHTHIALVKILDLRKPYLFTFVRDPLDAQCSAFFQNNRVRKNNGIPLIGAEEYIASLQPILAHWVSRFFGDESGKCGFTASELFRCFDCVIDMENYNDHVGALVDEMGLPPIGTQRWNKTSTQEKKDAFLSAEVKKIEQHCRENFKDDLELYREIKAILKSSRNASMNFSAASGLSAGQRSDMLAELTRNTSEATYWRHLAGAYASEARSLGLLAETREYLERKRNWVDLLGETVGKN